MPKSYNYTMKTGRPTKYKPEYVQVVKDYIDTCTAGNMKLPKRVDLAIQFNVHEDTLIEWGKRDKEFHGALVQVDMNQRAQLMDVGIYGGKEINPRIVELILKVNHKFIETDRTIVAGDKDVPLLINIIEDKPKTTDE